MVKVTYPSYRLIRAAAALLAPVYVLSTGIQTYAEYPSTAFVHVTRGNPSKVSIGRGTLREAKPVNRQGSPGSNQLVRDTHVLYVPAGDFSARLTFAAGNILEYARLTIQTIASSKMLVYKYPCDTDPGVTIGWRRNDDLDKRFRACDNGVTVGSSDGNAQLPNRRNPSLIQAGKNLLKAQVDNKVLVVPGAGETLIQTFDTGTGIDVVVAQGDVNVKSAKHPEGKTIKAGERYSYPQDTITPVDLKALAQSPSIQDFLNPANSSSPDIPQRIADGIADQLRQHRAALGLPPQPIASRPGNNNNPSQSPTASNPGTSINLSGDWTFNFGFFSYSESDPEGTCKAEPEAGPYQDTITITQNGNKLSVSAPSAVPMTTGTISGNQFEASGPSPMRWTGIFEGDGNGGTITGTGICGSARIPFKLDKIVR
jgi:hypothetical protein